MIGSCSVLLSEQEVSCLGKFKRNFATFLRMFRNFIRILPWISNHLRNLFGNCIPMFSNLTNTGMMTTIFSVFVFGCFSEKLSDNKRFKVN